MSEPDGRADFIAYHCRETCDPSGILAALDAALQPPSREEETRDEVAPGPMVLCESASSRSEWCAECQHGQPHYATPTCATHARCMRKGTRASVCRHMLREG